jgi:cardiolipin synthase
MPSSHVADTKKDLGDSVLALPNPYIHAKTFIIDDTFAYIGSNNFPSLSFNTERETTLFTYNPDVIITLNALFERDLSHATIP